jgi:hypothetical protein
MPPDTGSMAGVPAPHTVVIEATWPLSLQYVRHKLLEGQIINDTYPRSDRLWFRGFRGFRVKCTSSLGTWVG